jgi:hypothetical protein
MDGQHTWKVRQMQARKLDPETTIIGLERLTLGDFWSWAYSDLLSNGNRSVFAEFVVGTALGATQLPRREWDAVDLRYRGKTIEVKASAYVHSWAPAVRPTIIRFDIDKKRAWDPETNRSGRDRVRSADCYVFCMHPERDRDRALESVLDVGSWLFYVVATLELERRLDHQKTIGLAKLASLCSPVAHSQIKAAIDAVLGPFADHSDSAVVDLQDPSML